MERIDTLTGPPRTTIRRNNEVITFEPETKTAFVEKRDSLGVFPELLRTPSNLIPQFYAARDDDVDDLDGLRAAVLGLGGAGAADLGDLCRAGEVHPAGQVRRGGDDLDAAGDPPAPGSVDGPMGGDVLPGQRLQDRSELGPVALDGQDVVAAGVDDDLGGVVLGMHRIQGDHCTTISAQVEQSEKGSHGGDLVALRRGRQLSEHGPGGVVHSSDQVRQDTIGAARAAQALPVDGDHPTPRDGRRPGPHVRPDHAGQDRGVDRRQDPADRCLRRNPARDPQRGQDPGRLVAGPLSDHGIGPGAGHHRRDRDREHRRHAMAHTPLGPRIRHRRQHGQQTWMRGGGTTGTGSGRHGRRGRRR